MHDATPVRWVTAQARRKSCDGCAGRAAAAAEAVAAELTATASAAAATSAERALLDRTESGDNGRLPFPEGQVGLVPLPSGRVTFRAATRPRAQVALFP